MTKILFCIAPFVILLILLFIIFRFSEDSTKFDHLQYETEQLFNEYKNYNIPLDIFQTHQQKKIPKKMKKAIEKIKSHAPTCFYTFYNENARRKYIEKYYPRAINAYNLLIPHAYKSDLFRYIRLFVHGGIYFDSGFEPYNKNFKILEHLIHPDDDLIIAIDVDGSGGGILTGFLCSKPKNPVLYNTIELCIDNIINKRYFKEHQNGYLKTTGPLAIMQAYKQTPTYNQKIKILECDEYNIYYRKKPIYNIRYNGYRKDMKTFFKSPHYSKLWKDNNVFLPKYIHTYVSMTTIPERLVNDWWINNLKRNISLLNSRQTLVINIPYVSLKKKPYIIPSTLVDLQSENFIINRCVDEGPITKLLPSLRNDMIRDEDVLIICDDDIVYIEDMFNILENAVHVTPLNISAMCHSIIEGFKGFACKKGLIKDILKLKIPKACQRIDDDVINFHARTNNITIDGIPYTNDTDGSCSWITDPNAKDAHPEWPELRFDNRKPIIKKCINELNKPYTLPTIEPFTC